MVVCTLVRKQKRNQNLKVITFLVKSVKLLGSACTGALVARGYTQTFWKSFPIAVLSYLVSPGAYHGTTKHAAKLESPNVSTIINAAWPCFPLSVFKLVQANSYPLLSYNVKGGESYIFRIYRRFGLQVEANITDCGAAENLWRHPKWRPRWPPPWMLLWVTNF